MSDNHTLAEHMPALLFCFTSKFVMERNIAVDIRLPKTLTEEFQLCLKWKREHVI